MATKDFEKQLKKGQETEQIIDNLLHQNGWHTIPIYRHKYDPKNNKEIAPKLYGLSSNTVLPDILAFKDNKQLWIECKYELGASWTYSTQTFEHGISGRLFDSYKEIEKITKIPVWLIFHEKNQLERTIKDFADCKKYKRPLPPMDSNSLIDVLRGQRVINLNNQRHIDHGSNYKLFPYVFFPQNNFIPLGTIQNPDFIWLEIL